MSTMTYAFHSSCVSCHSVDCDFENHCEECANIDDEALSVYVRHRRLLLSKQRSKSKRKDLLLSASAIDNPVIVSDPPSSVELPLVSLDLSSVADEIKGTVRSEGVEISRNITFSEKIHIQSWYLKRRRRNI